MALMLFSGKIVQKAEYVVSCFHSQASCPTSNTKPTINNAVKKPVLQTFKKIIPTEIQDRKCHHLCFKCDEKFGLGHKSKQKEIHLLLTIDDDSEVAKSNEEDENIEYQGAQQKKDMEFAIHALFGKILHNTIKLKELNCQFW